MPETAGLNRLQWEEKLAAIGENLRLLGSSAILEIIGAWPVIEAGLEGRTSLDLDVWMPESDVDRSALANACAAAGREKAERTLRHPRRGYRHRMKLSHYRKVAKE